MWKKIKGLLKIDIWEINDKNLPKSLKFILNTARIISLAVKGFKKDKVQLQASALTFYTVLSIVPILAMAFGIAKGFGLEQTLQVQILEAAQHSQQKEVILWLLGFGQKMLANTKGGLVAGVGVVILLWSVMSIMGNIESSFNDIWAVKKSRSLLRKFTDYMAIMILAPLLLVSSGSITIFISSQVNQIAEQVEVLGFVAQITNFLLDLTPYILIWLVFFLVYLIMPNTKVNWKAALTGAIIAGSGFQIFEWIYINFQIGVAKYNAIYGSFAALPLFLIWLQTSWNLVLLGSEISYATQNYHQFAFESSLSKLSINFRKKLSLVVLGQILKDFENSKITTTQSLAEHLNFPQKIIHKITLELLNAQLIVYAEGVNEEEGFHPALSPEKITIRYFLSAFDKAGQNQFSAFKKPQVEELNLEELFQKNTLVKDI